MTDQSSNSSPHADLAYQSFSALANDYLKERKRKRRWGIFFKIIILLILAYVIYSLVTSSDNESSATTSATKPHIGLIDISGAIFDGAAAGSDEVGKALRNAYKDSGTKAVILRINSPGGSAVQADYIYNEIMRLKHQSPKIKVYAVCTDLCASAAYYIASAADEIYADRASLVGSIGVVFNGFGFVGAMDKLGIQRRLVTAGKNKGFMDPFSPEKPEEVEQLKKMLADVHQQFEESVIRGRKGRLKITPETFSGLIWTGREAKELGLIDAFGSAGFIAREIVKEKHVMDYTIKPNYWERISRSLSSDMGHNVLSQLANPKVLMQSSEGLGINAMVGGKN